MSQKIALTSWNLLSFTQNFIFVTLQVNVLLFFQLQSAKAGLIPRAMAALFDELRLQRAEFVVRISFMELYNEELYDLFAPDEVPPKLR